MKNIKGFETFEGQESVEQKSNEAKKWIQDAIKRPGSLRRKLKKEKGEKISSSEIDSELQALKAKDRDKDKPGLQLSKRDRSKQKQLVLAKTLRKLKEHEENTNYMFFSNLETIKRLVDELLQMDHQEMDQMLSEHDWASDHIATSKDDIEEVFNFFSGHESPESEDWNEMDIDND